MAAAPPSRLPAVLVACACALVVCGGARAEPPAPAGKTLTGMWVLEKDDFGKHEPMPLTAEGRKEQAARAAARASGDVLSAEAKRCLPPGMPAMMVNEFALEIVESPGRVTFISEMSPLVRSVYLTERAHPKGLEPSWNGHSFGRWDGGVLVVDTANLNDKAQPFGFAGVHSATTHVVERIHLEPGGDRLVDEMTFTDPRYLSASFTGVYHYRRLPADAELWEYACEVDAPGWSERYAGEAPAKAKP